MAKLHWIVKFSVDEKWVEDGFDLTDGRALGMLSRDLTDANSDLELGARVLIAPPAPVVAKLFGASSAAAVLRARDWDSLHNPAPSILDTLKLALHKLDSVAFLSTEGDTYDAKDKLRAAIKLLS